MNRLFISLVLVVTIVASFLVYWASTNTASLVLLPSQLEARARQNSNPVKLNRIRVAGRVSADPISFETEPMALLQFSLVDPPTPDQANSVQELQAPVKVVYRGIKPDMFASGRDVIVDGEYRDGQLIASNLLTQCPSKYEPPSPESLKHQLTP